VKFENPADDVITFRQCAGKSAWFFGDQNIGLGACSVMRKWSRSCIPGACCITRGGFGRIT